MSGKIRRRDFIKIVGVAGGASVLAACTPPANQPSQSGGQSEGSTAVAEAPASSIVTITFTGWGGTEEDEGVKSAARYFEEHNPDMKINWIQIPENYAEKTMAMVAAGTPPDTAFVYNTLFQGYAKDGLLLDVTDSLKADPVLSAPDWFIEPQEEERCTRDGKWYGIGSCWVAPHIYYNADIFEAEGITPPSNDPNEAWSWEQFVETSKQLTVDTNGKHPDETGFDRDNIERWAVQWPTTSVCLHAAIASNVGKWIDPETGMIVLDQPEAYDALQKVADTMLVDNISPRGAAFSALGLTNTQMLETGKLAMAVDGSWALSWITKINGTLGTAVLPKMVQPATDMQAHIHVAFAKTKYPEQAWRWLSFLGTEYYQLTFLKIGLWLPSQTALMTPEGMKKWYTERKAPGEGIHPAGYDKIVTQYVPKYGHVLYMPPGYNDADAIITPAMDAIWTGDKTAEEAMKAAVPEANKKLEEAKG